MFVRPAAKFSGGHAQTIAMARAARTIQARYDNAQVTDENKRNWWMADVMSAKSANSFQVRRLLRTRSRYECANNPYLFGISNSNADDLVHTGPTLQCLTKSKAFNDQVERVWNEWAAEVDVVEKIRTIKLAKSVDGEGFLVLKTVADLENPIKLYPLDIEADQVTTPAPANLQDLWVDGLTLHPVTGKPTAYHVLKHHPGDLYFPDFNPLKVELVPRKFVIHWFKKFRPGQVRGIPIFTSSLDLFTELRSFRRAVLGAQQIAASFAAVLESEAPPGVDVPTGTKDDPWDKVPIDQKMLVRLPWGMKMHQFEPKQPGTTYDSFQEKGLSEACRPLAYPLNLALGTSQKFNFSSARLDHINYRDSLIIERSQCETYVLNRLFDAVVEEAMLVGALDLAIDPREKIPHEWHWPGFEPLDPVADATADHARLANGTLTWREFWARRGYDWRDMAKQQAEELEEHNRLHLVFGDPVKKSITETPEDAEGHANAA